MATVSTNGFGKLEVDLLAADGKYTEPLGYVNYEIFSNAEGVAAKNERVRLGAIAVAQLSANSYVKNRIKYEFELESD